MGHPAFTLKLQSIIAYWSLLISNLKADLAWVAGYLPRWFTSPKTVTHPTYNIPHTCKSEIIILPLQHSSVYTNVCDASYFIEHIKLLLIIFNLTNSISTGSEQNRHHFTNESCKLASVAFWPESFANGTPGKTSGSWKSRSPFCSSATETEWQCAYLMHYFVNAGEILQKNTTAFISVSI